MPQLPDTRIALGGMSGGGERQSNPLGTLGQMMQIKEQQLVMQQRQRQAEQERRELEDDDETRGALQQYERPEEAIDHLWKAGRSTAATKLAQNVYIARKAELDEASTRLKHHSDTMGHVAQLLGNVTDEASLKTATKAIIPLTEKTFGPGVRDMIPTTYAGNEDKIKQLHEMGKSLQQQAVEKQQRIQNHLAAYAAGQEAGPEQDVLDPQTGKPVIDPETGKPKKRAGMWSPNGMVALEKHKDNVARDLSRAPNKEVYDQTLEEYYRFGTPEIVLKAFPPWLPDGSSPKIAARLGLTIPQEEANKVAKDRADSYDRAQDRADAAAQAGLNANQKRLVLDARDDEDKDIEAWVRQVYPADANKIPKTQWPKDASGKPVKPEFSLDRLSDEHKADYVRRRLQAENNQRKKIGGQLPIVDAAKKAIADGDRAGYEKVRSVFDNLTQGLLKLDGIAKPPPEWIPKEEGAAGGQTQAGPQSRPNTAVVPQVDKKQQLKELTVQQKAEKDPVKRAEITAKIRALATG